MEFRVGLSLEAGRSPGRGTWAVWVWDRKDLVPGQGLSKLSREISTR